jgi:uncharacterized RDD family membrane protein YckC
MKASEDLETTLPVAGPTAREKFVSGPMVYLREEYVGAFRHLLIFAVDAFVLYLLLFLLALIASPFGELTSNDPARFVILPLLVVSWIYLAVLKPSRFRSLGYWIADAKIITIDGKPPSPWRMTMRLLWASMYFFPYLTINFFTDLLWTTMNHERQMLRELMAGTRLVRNRAKPIADGKVTRCLFTGLGLTLFYARIRPKLIKADDRTPDTVSTTA